MIVGEFLFFIYYPRVIYKQSTYVKYRRVVTTSIEGRTKESEKETT